MSGKGRSSAKKRGHKGGEQLGKALAGRSGAQSASNRAAAAAKRAGLGGAAQRAAAARHAVGVERRERPALTSTLESNDLDSLMELADLAGRDWSAARGESVVVSLGGDDAARGTVVAPHDAFSREERAAAEAEHRGALRVPRRPPWARSDSVEELDARERSNFLEWRRRLAAVEEVAAVQMTPFEKNLEVWRQLWRVCERSDLVVQVVDARNPLLYYAADLDAYVAELSEHKRPIVLLNKSDLLPREARRLWARHFEEQGVDFIFWSAKAATELQALDEEQALGDSDAARQTGVGGQDVDDVGEEDESLRVLGVDELLFMLEGAAEEASLAAAAAAPPPPPGAPPRRATVGMVGFPNVGKSSTINALVGSKRTMVSSTPGKTKHFQTLNVTPGLMLCDCPGLVFPSFSRSKPDMVAAGVIPIDRLTDVRAPVGTILKVLGAAPFESCYNVTLPPRAGAAHVLAGVAASRNFVIGQGRPDETRTGRMILKDFANGKLLYVHAPPDAKLRGWAGHDGHAAPLEALEASKPASAASPAPSSGQPSSGASAAEGSAAAAAVAAGLDDLELDDDDFDLMLPDNHARVAHEAAAKPRRAAHKFQQTAPRAKARQKAATLAANTEMSFEDGATAGAVRRQMAAIQGKRGKGGGKKRGPTLVG